MSGQVNNTTNLQISNTEKKSKGNSEIFKEGAFNPDMQDGFKVPLAMVKPVQDPK